MADCLLEKCILKYFLESEIFAYIQNIGIFFGNIWKCLKACSKKIFEVEENWIFENIEETFENIKKDIEDIWKYWKIYSKTLENIEKNIKNVEKIENICTCSAPAQGFASVAPPWAVPLCPSGLLPDKQIGRKCKNIPFTFPRMLSFTWDW